MVRIYGESLDNEIKASKKWRRKKWYCGRTRRL